MCYSPVRHSLITQRVRLACVRHAASVYPEPGSNSPYIMFRTHSREVCSEDVERSQPNIISGCFTQIDRNCFCKQLLFCFPLFNCQGTTSKVLLGSTARNKCYRFSFKEDEEYIFYLPTAEDWERLHEFSVECHFRRRRWLSPTDHTDVTNNNKEKVPFIPPGSWIHFPSIALSITREIIFLFHPAHLS